MQISTLWDITLPEERYLTFTDSIDKEQIQPEPEKYFKAAPVINIGERPIEIPLERKGFATDPGPGIGIYKKIKLRKLEKEMPALFPSPDEPDTLPITIKEKDNSVTYIPDKVADQLVSNLINFLDNHPNTEVIFEEEKDTQETPKYIRNSPY